MKMKLTCMPISAFAKALVYIAFLAPLHVMAGDSSGKITTIYSHTKIVNGENIGVIMFNVENHTGQPDCSGREWAFNANDGNGKAMLSLLLSAASQNKSITVKGANNCADWHDREKPYWIRVLY